MMSIGLIEQLSQDKSMVVTYFFCQNADYELNTTESIIKGLMLRLVEQQNYLKECLRSRWDPVNGRFEADIKSWRILWDIFLEMLEYCKSQRIYVIVDALDECQNEGMAELLKLIVRTGLGHRSKIKWLLTSRPLDSAERELLGGSDQELVSLDLNSSHIAEAVKIYTASRVTELDRRQKYGTVLRSKVEATLIQKAEDTFLWVSLVCRRLECVSRDKVLDAIEELPPSLHPLYARILYQLNEGESAIVDGCMRILKVMLLVYRPLTIEEISSVTGLSGDDIPIEVLVDRCASFVRMRSRHIEFVHQSARDHLGGKNGQQILDAHSHFGHGEITLNCLYFLSKRLRVNLFDLSRPDTTRDMVKEHNNDNRNIELAALGYAAAFWVHHLQDAKQTTIIQKALTQQGQVGEFFQTKLLEWLECLSLLEELYRAIEGFNILQSVVKVRFIHFEVNLCCLNVSLGKSYPIDVHRRRYTFRISTLPNHCNLALTNIQFCNNFQP
jgi:hypothetical protein